MSLTGTVALMWLSGLHVPMTPRAMPAGVFTPLEGPSKLERTRIRDRSFFMSMGGRVGFRWGGHEKKNGTKGGGYQKKLSERGGGGGHQQ